MNNYVPNTATITYPQNNEMQINVVYDPTQYYVPQPIAPGVDKSLSYYPLPERTEVRVRTTIPTRGFQSLISSDASITTSGIVTQSLTATYNGIDWYPLNRLPQDIPSLTLTIDLVLTLEEGEGEFRDFTMLFQVDSQAIEVISNQQHNKTSFYKLLTSSWNSKVLNWSSNMYRKLHRTNIIPRYVERTSDYTHWWSFVTFIGGQIVAYVREWRDFFQSSILLRLGLDRRGIFYGIITDRQILSTITRQSLKEIQKRGTWAIRRNTELQGELLRLIGDQSITSTHITVPQRYTGWYLDTSSPVGALSSAAFLDEVFEGRETVEDLSVYNITTSASLENVSLDSFTQTFTITGTNVKEPGIIYSLIDSTGRFSIAEVQWDSLLGGTLSITFTPNDYKKYQATLTIETPSGADVSVPVIGQGSKIVSTPVIQPVTDSVIRSQYITAPLLIDCGSVPVAAGTSMKIEQDGSIGSVRQLSIDSNRSYAYNFQFSPVNDGVLDISVQVSLFDSSGTIIGNPYVYDFGSRLFAKPIDDNGNLVSFRIWYGLQVKLLAFWNTNESIIVEENTLGWQLRVPLNTAYASIIWTFNGVSTTGGVYLRSFGGGVCIPRSSVFLQGANFWWSHFVNRGIEIVDRLRELIFRYLLPYRTVLDLLETDTLPRFSGDPLRIIRVSFTNITCNDANNGTITIITSGGRFNHNLQWTFDAQDPDSWEYFTLDSELILDNLAPDTYEIFIRDDTGVQISRTFVLTEPDELMFTVNGLGYQQGEFAEIPVSAVGGTPDVGGQYRYMMTNLTTGKLEYDHMRPGAGTIIQISSPGIYRLEVQDKASKPCFKIDTINVNLPLQNIGLKYDHDTGLPINPEEPSIWIGLRSEGDVGQWFTLRPNEWIITRVEMSRVVLSKSEIKPLQ